MPIKWHIILLFTILAVHSSCYGSNPAPGSINRFPNPSTIADDTVKELAKDIMVVYQDKHNNVWFGSWSNGLYRYNGKTLLHYTTKDGLWHNRIDEIKEDRAGNIYINTSGGINKYDGKTFNPLALSSQSNTNWMLGPDDVWFRNMQASGSVYRYDGTTLHSLTFPATRLGDEFIAKHPLAAYPNMKSSPYDVYSIYKDTKGNIWFGTAVLGVCRFDGKSVDWISEEDVTELQDGPANGVRSIIEDQEGKFWFNNTNFQYTIYEEHGAFAYHREKGIGSLDGRSNGNLDEYLSAVVDDRGDVWIVTYTAGVWRYTGKNIIHYPVQDGAKNITLFSILQDQRGDLWLGTHESGVYLFNGKNFESFKPYRQKSK